MDTQRAFRFLVPGWLFILALGFHYWTLDGDLSQWFSGEYGALVGVLVALAAGPVLGFIVSTVTVCVLELRGEQVHLGVSGSKQDCLEVVNALRTCFTSERLQEQLDPETLELGKKNPDCLSRRSRRILAKKLHPLQNLALRIHGKQELLEFTVRRWTIFWSLANSIGAVLLGAAGAYFLRQYEESWSLHDQAFIGGRIFLELPWLVYLPIAIRRAWKARREAIDIESNWLIENAANPKRKATCPTSAHQP